MALRACAVKGDYINGNLRMKKTEMRAASCIAMCLNTLNTSNLISIYWDRILNSGSQSSGCLISYCAALIVEMGHVGSSACLVSVPHFGAILHLFWFHPPCVEEGDGVPSASAFI